MKAVIFIFLIAVSFSLERVFAQEPGPSDTLSVKDKCVIFWEPDPSQFDSLSAGKENNLERLSEFSRYTEQIIPFLKKRSMSFNKTSQKVLKVRMDNGDSLFIRKEDIGDIVGIVLTSGIRPPLILPGVTPDSEFFIKFKNYFEGK